MAKKFPIHKKSLFIATVIHTSILSVVQLALLSTVSTVVAKDKMRFFKDISIWLGVLHINNIQPNFYVELPEFKNLEWCLSAKKALVE